MREIVGKIVCLIRSLHASVGKIQRKQGGIRQHRTDDRKGKRTRHARIGTRERSIGGGGAGKRLEVAERVGH